MPIRDRAAWALAAVLSVALLMAPAIWNGFPLLQYDTGGYLARWYEGTLVPSRAVAYGLLLTASAPLHFWPAVLLQSALTVWVLALVLRTHGVGHRPWLLAATTAILWVITTLPWLTSILLTDTFAGLSVLALHLVVMRGEALRGAERAGLIALIAYAAATHSATLAVLLALLAAATTARLIFGKDIAPAGLARGALALVIGSAIVFAADFAVAGRVAWTPGGFALSFGRMLQDGIVARYLHEHCPDPHLRLCAHVGELPQNADAFFWGSSLFDRLGRFAGLGPEMQTIALESLIDYPWMQIETAAQATAQQLAAVHSGEGVVNWIWHTYAIIKKFTPSALPAMRAARQQHGDISFTAINRLHNPVALASMLLLLAIVALALRSAAFADLGLLATASLLAILANAFVCGVLSGPHDRYGARIVWIATLAVLLTAYRLLQATFAGRRTPAHAG